MFYPGITSNAISAMDAAKAASAATSAEAAARRAQMEIDLMRSDIERLLMITEALWGILKEKHGYTDDELRRRVADIDLRDGKLDGRVAATPAPPCPHCGRQNVNKRRPLCLYCGKPIEADPFQR